MDSFIIAGGILGIVTYFPLWKQIYSGKVSQNLFTYIFCVILDGILAIAIILQKGNYLLPVAYTVGSAITVAFILRFCETPVWTSSETKVSALIIFCMIIWYFSGNRTATIMASIATAIASIPQGIDAWNKPHEMPLAVYTSYFIANILSTAGGKCWSVEERFFSMTGVLICGLATLFSLRRFWLEKPNR